jgi:hypothetical protein
MKQIFVALAVMAIFASCKKDSTASGSYAAVPKKITSITYEGSASFFKMEYDAQDRVSKVLFEGGFATYQYNAGSVQYTEIHSNQAAPYYTSNMLLNADGTFNSGTYTEQSGNNAINGTLKFEYDANGFLTKRTDESAVNGKQEWKYTWTNGNLIKTESFKNGAATTTDYYDYYTDKPNFTQLNSWFWRTYYNKSLTGKITKNVVRSYLSKSPTNVINLFYQLTYDLDNDGNVLKTVAQNMIANSTSSSVYLYQ